MHSAVKLCALYIEDEIEGSAHSFTALCCVDIKEGSSIVFVFVFVFECLCLCICSSAKVCMCVWGLSSGEH